MLFHPFSKGQYFDPEQINVPTWAPTPQEWQQTIPLLTGKPSGTKLEKWLDKENKKGKRSAYSFIIIENVIYALSNKEAFESIKGAEGKIRQGVTYDNKLYAIKKEDSCAESRNPNAISIGEKLGLIISHSHSDKNICYTVMKWVGTDLFQYYEANSLNQTQRFLVALKSCLLLQSIHDHNILHRDIRSENMTLTINPDNPYDIDVKFIDWNFSVALKNSENTVKDVIVWGRTHYLSLEILTQCQYAKTSDNYALVITLLTLNLLQENSPKLNTLIAQYHNSNEFTQLFLNYADTHKVKLGSPTFEFLIRQLLAPNADERASLDSLIIYLCLKLKDNSVFDEKTKASIKDIKEKAALRISSSRSYLPSFTKKEALPLRTFPENTSSDPENVGLADGKFKND